MLFAARTLLTVKFYYPRYRVANIFTQIYKRSLHTPEILQKSGERDLAEVVFAD
ncbi:hypothetical protein SAMN05216379_10528 [Nitrosomonas eutropha]|nr:hypothetical protein SAMN05216379_10528 [Nitrosomonas eutropha]